MLSLLKRLHQNQTVVQLCRRFYLLANLWDLIDVIRCAWVVHQFQKNPTKTDDVLYETCLKLSIGQIHEEIQWAAEILDKHHVKTLIELGAAKAGNAFYLAQRLQHLEKLITVDLHPRIIWLSAQQHQSLTSQRKARAKLPFRKSGNRPFTIGFTWARRYLIQWRYSSKIIPYYSCSVLAEEPLNIQQKFLNQNPVDCLFYDADKNEYAVQMNLETYLPLLKPGGLLVIQDINYTLDSSNRGMRVFWDNLDPQQFKKVGENCAAEAWQHVVGGIGIAVKL